MKIVRKSMRGVAYLAVVLLEKRSVVTRAVFWRVPHNTEKEEVHLKIGRYEKDAYDQETLICTKPKSELTLDDEEFRNLLTFISENYEPFRAGVRKYIPIDESFDGQNIEHVRALFTNPDKAKLLQFIIDNDILPGDLVLDVQHQQRIRAIEEYERMLDADADEREWQRWFAANSWVLGSDFIRVLDERIIDSGNVADYLVQAYDGFLDIIEIKRPGGALRFWSTSQDHGNYVPSTDLIKAITQSTKYVFEIEREINSQKFLERVGSVPTVKPRCVLVFGRSHDWDSEQKKAYRILNASYHDLTIMTYDHVLARAKRLLGIEVTTQAPTLPIEASSAGQDDIPF